MKREREEVEVKNNEERAERVRERQRKPVLPQATS
jgi:hypothetical protein